MQTRALATLIFVTFAACGGPRSDLDGNPRGKGQDAGDEDGADSGGNGDGPEGTDGDNRPDDDNSGTDTDDSEVTDSDGQTDDDRSPPPEGWECAQNAFDDNAYCDCGCGVVDPDCEAQGCSESGCDASACDNCHADGEYIICASDMQPGEWTCSDFAYEDGSTCNCGCGAPDPDCGEAGCFAQGCDHPACDYCTDDDGDVVSCPSSVPPEGWICTRYDYNDTSCDCGCGLQDPSCEAEATCDANGCSAICDYCFDSQGRFMSCGND